MDITATNGTSKQDHAVRIQLSNQLYNAYHSYSTSDSSSSAGGMRALSPKQSSTLTHHSFHRATKISHRVILFVVLVVVVLAAVEVTVSCGLDLPSIVSCREEGERSVHGISFIEDPCHWLN